VEDAEGTLHETFDAMTLAATKVRLLDVYGLTGNVQQIWTVGDAAFFGQDRGYWAIPFAGDETAPKAVPAALVALDLAWPDTVREAAKIELGEGWANLDRVEDGYAFISAGDGELLVYDVMNPYAMRKVGSFKLTHSWWNNRMHFASDGRLYLPNGLYGLDVLSL
jgi:hypothetical protein